MIYYAENRDNYSQSFTFKFEIEDHTSQEKELSALRLLLGSNWSFYHIGGDWKN